MLRILGVCGFALVASVGWAAESPESLIPKLGSPRYADREAAGRELLKLGAAALPAVKAAAESSSNPEIRERAIALLEPLSRTEESLKRLTVKPVRIAYKSVPLASAIADFKSRTGIPLTLLPEKVKDPARLITVPAGEYPPWIALDVLLKAAGLKEDHRSELPGRPGPVQTSAYSQSSFDYGGYSGGGMLYTPATAPILLVDGTAEELPCVRSGGVRILALPPNFAANRVVRGAGRVIFHLDAAPVPGTGWHGASGVRVTLAEDEEGRPVFSDLKLTSDPFAAANPYGFQGGWGGRRVFWGGGGGGMAWIDDSFSGGTSPNSNPRLVSVALRTNDRAVRKLRRFEGAVLGEVHTPNVPIVTIDNLEKSIGSTHNGPNQSTLAVQEVKKQKDGSTIVKVRHEALTQWALQNMGRAINSMSIEDPNEAIRRLKFYDASGRELKNPAQQSTSYTGDGFRQSVEVSLRFPKNASTPVKLVLTGTRVTAVEVPFKMVDVSVP